MDQPQQQNILKEKHANGVSKGVAKSVGIPSRWLHCPKIGKVIQYRFLPFKTPLSEAYDDLLNDETKFHPQHIFDTKFDGTKEDAKVKLWINLAYTERYYGWKAVTSNDCEYYHTPLRGHEETPSEEDVDRFIEIVNNFVKDHPNDIIAVHCTHGFNRTGFLIAAYLIKTQGFEVIPAIKEFTESRPSGIYKEEYLRELLHRYSDSYNPDAELPFEVPSQPDWDINVGEAASTIGFADNSDRKPQFQNGRLRGVELIDDSEMQQSLWNEIRVLLQPFSEKSLQTTHLFSTHPVSLDKKNIELLSTKSYMVSWKADGIRYLIYIKGKNEVYAFNRDKHIFKLPLKFPKKDLLNQHISETLIDVEMVVEKVIVGGGKTFYNNKMLIFDMIYYEGKNIGKESFQKRYDAINTFLIFPRSAAVKYGRMDKRKEPITVYRKEFYSIAETKKLLSPEFAQALPHRIDGLIFQPIDDPYTCGRFPNLLKWKDAENTTIDFCLKIVEEKNSEDGTSKFYAELYLIGNAQPFRKMKAPEYVQKMDGRIVECGYRDKRFFVKRERKDKSSANSYWTALSIMRNLGDPVTKEFLIEYIEKNGLKQEPKQQPLPRQTYYNRNNRYRQ